MNEPKRKQQVHFVESWAEVYALSIQQSLSLINIFTAHAYELHISHNLGCTF